MSSRHSALALALLTAGMLALAGCGGGGGDETTAAPATTTETPSKLSKQELITQGDAICAEVNAAVGTVDASEAEGSAQVTQAADLYSGMVERIKSLGEPSEAQGYPEFVAAADDLARAENDAKLAFERNEESALAGAQEEVSTALEDFQEAASGYGFQDCAEAPSAPVVPATSEAGEEVESGEEEEVAEPVEEVAPEEAAPEEAAPEAETGGAGGTAEGGGTGAGGGGETGGASGGIGPG
jgi:hypothetical protein